MKLKTQFLQIIKKVSKKIYITVGLLLFGIPLVFTLLLIAFNSSVGNTFYPNTYIDNIQLGYKTPEEVTAALEKRDEYLKNATFEVVYDDTKIATFSAEELKLGKNVKEVVDKAYLVGRSTHTPSRIAEQIRSMLRLRKFTFNSNITYTVAIIDQFLQESQEIYNRPAKNALFTFENGRVTTFKAHENGLKIDSEKFLADFHNIIRNIDTEKKTIIVTLEADIIKPEITLAEANNQGIEELIGEGTSDYSHSIPSRIHNVLLAASKFNGVLIPKGEEFSFNEIIGDISANTGYQQAYVIQNGRTVLGDGGGVCQVSTTAFRAAINTGLPIVERHAHAYRVSYYENDSQPGFDATIYTPTVDLRFKNDTQAAILIQTEVDEANNILTFKFYGKKDDRKVEISPVTIWDVVPPPEPKYEDDPTLAKDTIKQVDYPAWGSKASFEYKVYKNGEQVISDTFYSAYRPWAAVYLKGTKEG